MSCDVSKFVTRAWDSVVENTELSNQVSIPEEPWGRGAGSGAPP